MPGNRTLGDPIHGTALRRPLDAYVLGSSIVVHMVRVGYDGLRRSGLRKHHTTPAGPDTHARLLAALPERRTGLQPGGSGENTAVGIAQLGGRAAYAGAVGDDAYGALCRESLHRHGVAVTATPRQGATGTCVVLVTPDGERTMSTYIGVSGDLRSEDVCQRTLSRSRWLFVEGYLFASSVARPTVFATLERARDLGVRVALSLAAPFVVERFGEPLRRAVNELTDLVFANELEAAAFTGAAEPGEAARRLAGEGRSACVTLGVRGSYVCFGGTLHAVPAAAAVPIDLTGVGDMYAAGLLIGLERGLDPVAAARLASNAARRVVLQLGPRLRGSLRDLGPHLRQAGTAAAPQPRLRELR